MIKRILIVGAALSLAACQTTEQPQLITKTYTTVDIPSELLAGCPIVKLPASKTITNRQLAELIVTYSVNNVKCNNSVQAIKKYLQEAKIVVES